MAIRNAVNCAVGRARTRRRGLVIGIGLLAVMLALEIGAVAINHAYEGRAMPGTLVAGESVGGRTAAEIEAKVATFAPPSSVRVRYRSTEVRLDPAALGLHVDPARSARAAVTSGRATSQLGTVFALGQQRSEQVVTGDEPALQRALDDGFDGVLQNPTEPSVTYDQKAGRFVLRPGKAGERLDAAAVLRQLSLHWRAGRPVTVTAGTIATAPVTSDAQAEAARAQADRMIAHDLTITAGGATVTVPRATLATFVQVSKPDGAPFSAHLRPDTVEQYITRNLRPRVETKQADTIRLTAAGGKVTETLPGSVGRSLGDTAKVAAAISDALTAGKEKVAVPASERASAVRTVRDGVHSVDVDLSTQTLALQVNGKTVRSFTISSGKPATPTVQGTFRVYHKTKVQDMSGGSGDSAYVLKDVRWNSFFSGNYAFHTANWHDDFGRPVSHGCVNMREADAKTAFEFAPVGTKVTVHD